MDKQDKCPAIHGYCHLYKKTIEVIYVKQLKFW
jgi:hypothetical protein